MSDQTFPEQIILEILTRLPAKSAARFKVVSKRFNALISHPHFIRTYISRAPKTWFLLDRLARVNSPSRSEFAPPPRVSSLSVTFTPENYPSVLISASNGLVLVACVAKRDPRQRNPAPFSTLPAQDNLFVFNPVTNEWAGLSYPLKPIERFSAGFTCRVDQLTGLVDRFLVVQYRPKLGADFAMVQCFSSETGKWEEMQGTGKWEEMQLNRRMWRGDGVFEFGGTLFWIDLTIGLIFLKDDINLLGTGKNHDKQLQFEFIKLPKGCERAFSTIGLEKSRFIGVGGGAELGWIQFLEVQVQEKAMKLWRLNDYKCGDWSVAYKVFFETEFWGMVPKQLFFHPFEAHVVVCALDGGLLFVNLITKEVQRCASYSNEATCMIPAVIPGWPSPLPKMNAEGAKERGNEFFKEKKYEEAVRWYTTSITRSPTAVAYANRAAAYLNLNNFIEAEKDCTDCLYLDEHFLKAYWRRAVVRKELGKLGDALEDAEHGLKVDPNHAEMMKLAGEIKSLLEQGTPVEDVGGSSVSSM